MIESLFPTPVMLENIGRRLTNAETSCIEKALEDQRQNSGNTNTNNVYLLDENELVDLKLWIETQLQKYMDEVVCPINDVKFKITISWGNETKTLGHHHAHNHANSILSGVFYPEVSETDKIFFNAANTLFGLIDIHAKEYNPHNSKSWWLPVKNGDLVLFPSQLNHNVPMIETERRVSIAFNTWIEGEIGIIEDLTYMKF